MCLDSNFEGFTRLKLNDGDPALSIQANDDARSTIGVDLPTKPSGGRLKFSEEVIQRRIVAVRRLPAGRRADLTHDSWHMILVERHYQLVAETPKRPG